MSRQKNLGEVGSDVLKHIEIVDCPYWCDFDKMETDRQDIELFVFVYNVDKETLREGFEVSFSFFAVNDADAFFEEERIEKTAEFYIYCEELKAGKERYFIAEIEYESVALCHEPHSAILDGKSGGINDITQKSDRIKHIDVCVQNKKLRGDKIGDFVRWYYNEIFAQDEEFKVKYFRKQLPKKDYYSLSEIMQNTTEELDD